jgi:hypothetical protein
MEAPKELKFHVDEKILKAIDDAVILHKKGVSVSVIILWMPV